MGKPIRVLILEDTETDAELMEEELREAGITFVSKRVAAEQTYLEALEREYVEPSPYDVPEFSAGEAVQAVEELLRGFSDDAA